MVSTSVLSIASHLMKGPPSHSMRLPETDTRSWHSSTNHVRVFLVAAISFQQQNKSCAGLFT